MAAGRLFEFKCCHADCGKALAFLASEPPLGARMRSDAMVMADGSRATFGSVVRCPWCQRTQHPTAEHLINGLRPRDYLIEHQVYIWEQGHE